MDAVVNLRATAGDQGAVRGTGRKRTGERTAGSGIACKLSGGYGEPVWKSA